MPRPIHKKKNLTVRDKILDECFIPKTIVEISCGTGVPIDELSGMIDNLIKYGTIVRIKNRRKHGYKYQRSKNI